MSKHNASGSQSEFSYDFEARGSILGIIPRSPTLYITIGNDRRSISYYTIGVLVIIDSTELIDKFGLTDTELYRHQFGFDGDRYESMDIAVLAWGLKYWHESNRVGEYGAYIYEEAEGIYYVGEYVTQENPVHVSIGQPTDRNTVVGSVHTHPGFANNRFSQDDYRTAYDNSRILGREFTVYLVSSNQVRSTRGASRPHFAQPHLHWKYQSVDERTVYSGLRYN